MINRNGAVAQVLEATEMPVVPLAAERATNVNLKEEYTGVAGTTYISTAPGGYGARVSRYPARPSEGPCRAVAVGGTPRNVNQNVRPRLGAAAALFLTKWAADKRRALLYFWINGLSRAAAEVYACIKRLARVC